MKVCGDLESMIYIARGKYPRASCVALHIPHTGLKDRSNAHRAEVVYEASTEELHKAPEKGKV